MLSELANKRTIAPLIANARELNRQRKCCDRPRREQGGHSDPNFLKMRFQRPARRLERYQDVEKYETMMEHARFNIIDRPLYTHMGWQAGNDELFIARSFGLKIMPSCHLLTDGS
jgi:hypothetical protein